MNIWKIIYLNCGERYEYMIDHRSYAHNLSSSEIKAWLKAHSAELAITTTTTFIYTILVDEKERRKRRVE